MDTVAKLETALAVRAVVGTKDAVSPVVRPGQGGPPPRQERTDGSSLAVHGVMSRPAIGQLEEHNGHAILTRRVKLPGRGTTRVLECPGPPGAPVLMLIHGVTFTAELNWGRVLEPLGRAFRVLALDQRGHGHGIGPGSRFRLEDCADDIAALAAVLGIERFIAVGYSMGGIVAQLLYRRHPSVVSGLVLCTTARNVRESPMENLVALTLPTLAVTMRWNPMVQVLDAGVLGTSLLGYVDDAATREWARAQLRQTSLTTAISAIQAVCEFTSNDWIGQVEVPTAVVITTRDRIVPASRQRKLAAAIPGAAVFELEADHGVCVNAPELFSRALLDACRSVEDEASQRLGDRSISTISRVEDIAGGLGAVA